MGGGEERVERGQRRGGPGGREAGGGECVLTRPSRAERYLEQLKHAKVKGYLFEQQNYVEKS